MNASEDSTKEEEKGEDDSQDTELVSLSWMTHKESLFSPTDIFSLFYYVSVALDIAREV